MLRSGERVRASAMAWRVSGGQPRAPVVGGQDLRHGLWCWLWHLQWCFLRRDLWCLGLVLAPLVQLLSHPFQRDGELL